MLCSRPFVAREHPNYDERWAIVPNEAQLYSSDRFRASVERYGGQAALDKHAAFIEKLTAGIEDNWQKNRMTPKDKAMREKIRIFVEKALKSVYPGGHMLCGGSSTSQCGTLKADLDLCYAVRTHKREDLRPDALPIKQYDEYGDVNAFMLDRICTVLRKDTHFRDVAVVGARVPLITCKLMSNKVDEAAEEMDFHFDIQCNCVAGIYNSYLLGGFVNFDSNLAKLSIILKDWAKRVKVHDQNRFNAYTVVLLIVHYLQCGVSPPVLPNLVALCSETYDGTYPPWECTTDVDLSRLPNKENEMSVGELLIGFFYYYKDFDFNNYGILIREAAVIPMREHGRFGGTCGSRVFIEEPYDGLTVPKNVREERTLRHIMYEIAYAWHALNFRHDDLFFRREHEPRRQYTNEHDLGVVEADWHCEAKVNQMYDLVEDYQRVKKIVEERIARENAESVEAASIEKPTK